MQGRRYDIVRDESTNILSQLRRTKGVFGCADVLQGSADVIIYGTEIEIDIARTKPSSTIEPDSVIHIDNTASFFLQFSGTWSAARDPSHIR